MSTFEPGAGVRAQTWTLDDARHAFEEDRERARSLAAGLNHDVFNRRARRGAWSVGQCLDHLCVVGRQLLPRIDAAVETARAKGYVADPGREIARTSWIDRALVRAMGPKSEREARLPVRSPERFRPRDTALEPAEVLARFDALATDLSALVDRAGGLDLSRVRVRSIVVPIVAAGAGAWIAVLATHQDRHLLQAARARAQAQVMAAARSAA